MVLVLSLYFILSFTGLLMYGHKVNQSLLVNIGTKYLDNKVFVEAYVMQFLFLIILASHIPYLFFSGKESFLIIIDELMR